MTLLSQTTETITTAILATHEFSEAKMPELLQNLYLGYPTSDATSIPQGYSLSFIQCNLSF